MGLRAGTVPLPLAVGFGVAAQAAAAEAKPDGVRITRLRDFLLDRLHGGVPGLTVNGAMSARIAGNLNLTLPKVDAEALLLDMPNIAISTGSACASGMSAPSAVLAGLGLGPDEAARSLRMCLGRFTSEEEVEEAADTIISVWNRLAASQSPA